MKTIAIVIVMVFNISTLGFTKTMICIGDKVNIRAQPRTESNIIGQCNIGDRVKFLGDNSKYNLEANLKDYWIFIEFNNLKGWIYGQYLTDSYIVDPIVKTDNWKYMVDHAA